MTRRLDPDEQRAIDARYGLEPVLEPCDQLTGEISPFAVVQCPYCGEPFETRLDLSAGSFRYVEDCQVCCQPIELAGEVDEAGQLLGLGVQRD